MTKFKHLEDDNHKFFHINAGTVDNDTTGKKWIERQLILKGIK